MTMTSVQRVAPLHEGRDAALSTATPWEAGRFDTRAGPRKVLFGQMYEDVEVERAAFAPGARVFCIASAGDTAMALSAAHDVTAIDINPVQLEYARARLSGAPAVTGTAERVVGLGRGAMALFGWRRDVLERFLALDDPAAQTEYWRAHLDTRGFRIATDTLLSVAGLKAVYASPFLAILPAHFGQVMRARLARCFGAFANRGNRYARALLLGELPPAARARRGAHHARAGRRCRVSGAVRAGVLRRVHAVEHSRRRAGRVPPAAVRGRPARGRHPARRSCCAASRSRRMRRPATRPRATVRSCGAWSTCVLPTRSTTPPAFRFPRPDERDSARCRRGPARPRPPSRTSRGSSSCARRSSACRRSRSARCGRPPAARSRGPRSR